MSCEPFITPINTHHIYHKRQWFQGSDSVYSGRISSIPDGYRLFRTDSVHSERMQDIRDVSGEFIAFHMHLYSSAVFPVLDRTRHQFTSTLKSLLDCQFRLFVCYTPAPCRLHAG